MRRGARGSRLPASIRQRIRKRAGMQNRRLFAQRLGARGEEPRARNRDAQGGPGPLPRPTGATRGRAGCDGPVLPCKKKGGLPPLERFTRITMEQLPIVPTVFSDTVRSYYADIPLESGINTGDFMISWQRVIQAVQRFIGNECRRYIHNSHSV